MILLCQQEANSEIIGTVDRFFQLRHGDMSAQKYKHEIEDQIRKMEEHLGVLPEPYKAYFTCNPTAATVSQSYPLRVSVAPAHRAVGFSVSPHFHPHIRWVPSLDIVAQHPPVILHLSPLGHGAGVQRHPR